MPHSLGGIYATYWQSMYPDEIEGVIFIDTTEVGIDVWNYDDYNVSIFEKMGNTKLIILPGDHIIFEQRPQDLNKIISEFLSLIKELLNLF